MQVYIHIFICRTYDLRVSCRCVCMYACIILYILRRQAVFFFIVLPGFSIAKNPDRNEHVRWDLFDRICILNEKTDLQVFYTRNNERTKIFTRARAHVRTLRSWTCVKQHYPLCFIFTSDIWFNNVNYLLFCK